MGPVSRLLIQRIAEQVERHGIVVWYDPGGQYRELAEQLDRELPDTTLALYRESFFELRHEVDHLLEGEDPPRLVVYVPLDPAETHHALVELEVAGVVMKPGQQPPLRNTRLAVVARAALTPILGEDKVRELEKRIEAGQLTLADLDRLAEQGEWVMKGVLGLVYDKSEPQEIALEFITRPDLDSELESKGAVEELRSFLAEVFGVDLSPEEPLEELRARFVRHLLATEFITGLEQIPGRLKTVPIAPEGPAREAVIRLVHTWRARRDLLEDYLHHAAQVERELGLHRIGFGLETATSETFPVVEEKLQEAVEARLLEAPSKDLVELAERRRAGFWAEARAEVQARWALIATTGRVFLEAERVEKALKAPPKDAAGFLHAYASAEEPWCLLDTYHRHMERRFHTFEFHEKHGTLERLVYKARERYVAVGSALATAFLKAYAEAGFTLPGLLSQREVWRDRVRPLLETHKVAYFLVDALRYEIARELKALLEEDFEVELEPVVATPPTITTVGMAALLPDAENELRVSAQRGNLLVEVDGVPLKDRASRVRYLEEHAGVPVVSLKLEDLLPSPKKRVREAIKEARFVLVTSQEIDALCEGDNIPLARRTMDSVQEEIAKACRILARLGVEHIIITADHGYLFGEELGPEMKVDPPGGETLRLHRRVWIGRGGRVDEAYLRAPLSAFGIASDLEVATPWGFAGFKVQGGARAYFHGGLSPQELVIPVVQLVPKRVPPATVEISWRLIPGSRKLSTRFFSVQITGEITGLFKGPAPKVRLEIRAAGKPVSQPVTASYGFEEASGAVQLRFSQDDPQKLEPNTVTLMVVEEIREKMVSVHLLDATSEVELARLDNLEVAISI